MPNFQFKPDQRELTPLLEQISTGALQLPDFQRGWVLDDDRPRSDEVETAVGGLVV